MPYISTAEQIGIDKGLEQGKVLGLEQGKVLGLEQGKVLGLEQGKVQGLEHGKVLGLEQGKVLGLEHGKVLGEFNEKMKTAQAMLAEGCEPVFIAKITQLSSQQIQELQQPPSTA